LVLLIGGLVLWELYTIRANRRRKRTFDRNRSELERLRSGESVLTASAQLNAARLKVVVDSTTDGIALFDSGLRLVQWNHPFFRGIGVEPIQDMPLDSLLRAQATNGLFGSVPDAEAEIGRRVGILRSGDATGLPQHGPNGETLIVGAGAGAPSVDGNRSAGGPGSGRLGTDRLVTG
jgi:PAS domain-containing protein